MTGKVPLGLERDLQPGDRVFVDLDGRDICVFNHEGEYYAVLNRCPHQGGEVGKGEILPEVTVMETGPGRAPKDVYSDVTVITCPWHGWEFDITTGKHCGVDDIAVPTYDIVTEDGQMYLKL